MERDFLKRYLEQGLSLNEIGALVNCDASTVGYWVQKHGLVANGRAKYAPRGGLSREQLEPLVEENLTLGQIADRLGVSVSTVRHWLRRYGLKPPAPAAGGPPHWLHWRLGGRASRPPVRGTGGPSSSSSAVGDRDALDVTPKASRIGVDA